MDSQASSSEEVARRVVVKGRVTGVGFRFFTVRQAESVGGIKGYVRNADNSTVECVLQGPEPKVHKLIRRLREGPGMASVRDMEIEDISPDPNRDAFHVAY